MGGSGSFFTKPPPSGTSCSTVRSLAGEIVSAGAAVGGGVDGDTVVVVVADAAADVVVGVAVDGGVDGDAVVVVVVADAAAAVVAVDADVVVADMVAFGLSSSAVMSEQPKSAKTQLIHAMLVTCCPNMNLAKSGVSTAENITRNPARAAGVVVSPAACRPAPRLFQTPISTPATSADALYRVTSSPNVSVCSVEEESRRSLAYSHKVGPSVSMAIVVLASVNSAGVGTASPLAPPPYAARSAMPYVPQSSDTNNRVPRATSSDDKGSAFSSSSSDSGGGDDSGGGFSVKAAAAAAGAFFSSPVISPDEAAVSGGEDEHFVKKRLCILRVF